MTVPATTRAALTDFVLERIAEDEADANELARQHDRWIREQRRNGADGSQGSIVASLIDPARVLAECSVKRRIVGMFQVARVIQECKSYPGEESAVRLMVDALEGVVRVHATAYADHPDYQTNWRPIP